jgi:hypothetical protein
VVPVVKLKAKLETAIKKKMTNVLAYIVIFPIFYEGKMGVGEVMG